MRLLPVCLVIFCASCAKAPSNVLETPSNGIPRIAMQPIGYVPEIVLDSVRASLLHEHALDVMNLPSRPHPKNAFIATRSPRYRADTLIAWLREIKPDSIDLIIGITTLDVSITKYGENGRIKEPSWKYCDFGIFGLGYLNGPSCVVSTYRLGAPKGTLFFNRLKKISVHEVGHNRGLAHCSDTTCVMRDAVEHISSIDAAGGAFCAICTSLRSSPKARTP